MIVDPDTVRVLHVDDEPDFAPMVAQTLELEDDRFDVETATTVDEAMEELSPDLDCIVSDYDMPETTGIEFAEEIRERYPDLPFILYTGKGSEEVASEAITAGVTEYLQKESGTAQYSVLANRIANSVEQYRSQQRLEANREQLSLFIEQSSFGVIQFDENVDIVSINPAAEEILGYAEEDLVGGSWDQIVSEESYDDVDEVTSALANAEGGYHSIDENVRKDGERIRCEYHNRVVTDDDGDVVAIFAQFQEVTERERQKAQLERTSARLEALFEGSPDMINIHDAEGRIMTPNTELAEATGYDKSALKEMDVWDLDRSLDPERAQELWEEMAPGERTRVEGQYERRDGTTFPVEAHIRRVDIEGEKRFVVTSRDISRRVEREDRLQEQNSLLSTLFDTLPVGVLAEDADRTVLAVNDHITQLFGVDDPASDLTGCDCRTLAESVADQFEAPDEFLARIESLVETGERVDGEEVALEDDRTYAQSYTPLALPDGPGHLWVYWDVTQRKTYEDRLHALNQTTQDLIDASTTHDIASLCIEATSEIIGFDVNAVYRFVDDGERLAPVAATDRALELFGELPVFEPGDSIAWRVATEGTSLTLDNPRDDPSVYNGETPIRSELYFPIGDHGVLIAGSKTTESFDRYETALGEILAGTVASTYDQLERTAELRAHREELERKNDRLEEFTNVVSHDLRNPINVAQGHLELASDECDSDHLERVAHAQDRMADLVEDLLVISRTGYGVTDPEPVNLASVVDDCWANVATEAASIDIRADEAVVANRDRLLQAFENLIRNAVEHGGADVTITVDTFADGFFIADDGPGIAPEDREAVFEGGYSDARDGTGFGLSIVEQVVEAHDWAIRVTDSEAGGARFEITEVNFD